MNDPLQKSITRYMNSQGKDYTSPTTYANNAKTVALRKAGIRKLKVKSVK